MKSQSITSTTPSQTSLRKQIYELTAGDLERFPVWECALDEEADSGDAAVRPYAGELEHPCAAELCAVRAEFQLADGTIRTGYFTPSGPGVRDMSALQPVVVTEEGQVPFWLGALRPAPNNLAECYATLGRPPRGVFPIRFRSAVPVGGEAVEGEIEGFYYLEPGRSLFSAPRAVKVVR